MVEVVYSISVTNVNLFSNVFVAKKKVRYSMDIIKVEHLTKDYGHNRGVFDVSFTVKKGEVFGFLGPNGAGKTTTIRHIMGFSKPQSGMTVVSGKNSWEKYYDIQKELGYLPGEIALPESLTGTEFIQMMADLRGIKDMSYTEHLLKLFELDPSGSLKRMSLGMKRKLAVVTAFMHDPQILVLDEPTSGLDPVMQNRFIEFIQQEKKRGKTILLSSHIFSEIDATCDRIAIIKDGHLVSTFIADELRHNKNKTFKIEFFTHEDYERFVENTRFEITVKKPHKNQVKVSFNDENIKGLVMELSLYKIRFLSEIKFTLEDYFMSYYDRNEGGNKNVTNRSA